MIARTSKRSSRVSVAVLSVFVSSALVAPRIVEAASIHDYSTATDSSAGQYTGVSQFRVDAAVTGLANVNCAQPFYPGSDPVYQTQWNQDGAGNWVELGTGHQCYNGGPGGAQTYRYHFWGRVPKVQRPATRLRLRLRGRTHHLGPPISGRLEEC
jgi:hypothetical protein